MKKSRIITALILFLAGIILRFAFSGHNYIAYGLFLLSVFIVVFGVAGKTLRRFLAMFLAMGLVYFVIIEIPIIDEASGDGDFDADYLIVLGAAVHGDTPPFPSWKGLKPQRIILLSTPTPL